MNPGDPVEVRMVWASNGRLQEPSRRWFKGYEFVAIEDVRDEKVIRVRVTEDNWQKGVESLRAPGDVKAFGSVGTSWDFTKK